MDNEKEATHIRKFLFNFSYFKRKLEDATTFNAVESMWEGFYEIVYKNRDVKCQESIYNNMDVENKFLKVLQYLKIPINTPIPFEKRPLWSYKSYEEMTDKEKKEYDEHIRMKYTWEEGDLEFVGYAALVDKEKK